VSAVSSHNSSDNIEGRSLRWQQC